MSTTTFLTRHGGRRVTSPEAAFILNIYLRVRDHRIPPLADLVPRDAVESYPTNFAPVKPRSLQELTIRGEQVSRLLLAQHLPELK